MAVKTGGKGSYSYVCDGTTPGSPVLSDGHTTFTAGLSSTINNMTSFRHEDALGSLRFLTDGGQNVLGSSVFEAFGTAVGATGSTAGASFGWVGGADCQTDADTGLVLMGHRLYDSRLGRFLSQDPKGAGSNWYRYAGNDPLNKIDPSGLSAINAYSAPDGRNQGPMGGNTGHIMDFFANMDYWASQGQGNGMEYGAGKKSGPKPEPVFAKKDDAGIAAAKAAYLKNPVDHENFGFILSIIINKTLRNCIESLQRTQITPPRPQ